MDFNLQTFLQDMDARHTAEIRALGTKIDGVVASQADHATRITVLENTRRAVKWLVTTTIGALLAALSEFAMRHLGR